MTIQLNPETGAYVPSELEQKVIEALHSGKYQQTIGTLRDEKGYCCLGVVCDIMDSAAWEKDEDRHYFKFITPSSNPATGALPLWIQDKLKWDASGRLDFIGRTDAQRMTLVICNDVCRLTFDQIADLIQHGLVDKNFHSEYISNLNSF